VNSLHYTIIQHAKLYFTKSIFSSVIKYMFNALIFVKNELMVNLKEKSFKLLLNISGYIFWHSSGKMDCCSEEGKLALKGDIKRL